MVRQWQELFYDRRYSFDRDGQPRFRVDRPRQRHRIPLRRAARGAAAGRRRHEGPCRAPICSKCGSKTRKTSSRWFRPALRSRTSGSNNNDSMEQEYIITVFSENKVGLLSQITTVFTCRNVNIESLTTSESALAGIQQIHDRRAHRSAKRSKSSRDRSKSASTCSKSSSSPPTKWCSRRSPSTR